MTESEAARELRVAVCVCTFKRPTKLSRLLDSFLGMERPPSAMFVIVDNDGNDPEVPRRVNAFRDTCRAHVEYVVERKPGISAARNAAFAAARSLGANAIAMLDDDEWPSAAWLTRLIETRHATGAAVIGGPVEPVFPEGHRQFGKYKDLWSVRRGNLHGRTYVYCTCNFLVDLTAVSGDRPFVDDLGLTGGEDAVFFRRLFFAGVSMAWCEDAIVFEEVSALRATIGWMRRRWYRQGNAGVVCEKLAPDPRAFSPLVKTVFLCGRLLFFPAFNRNVLGSPLLWLFEFDRVRGRIARHMGFAFAEYARTGPSSGPASP